MANYDKQQVGDKAAAILTHGQLMLGLIDELEAVPTIFRHDFKYRAKAFVSATEKLLHQVHGPMSQQENNNVMACYDDYLLALAWLDRLSVQERQQFVEMLDNVKFMIEDRL